MKTNERIESMLLLLEEASDIQYWMNAINSGSEFVSCNERDFVEENEFRLHQPGLKTAMQRFYGWRAVKALIVKELLCGQLTIENLHYLDYLDNANDLQLAVADLFKEWEAQGIVQRLEIEKPEYKEGYRSRSPWLNKGTTSYKYEDYIIVLGSGSLTYKTYLTRVKTQYTIL